MNVKLNKPINLSPPVDTVRFSLSVDVDTSELVVSYGVLPHMKQARAPLPADQVAAMLALAQTAIEQKEGLPPGSAKVQ